MKPGTFLDRSGKPINIGDLVRVIGLPELEGMTPLLRAETLAIFRRLLGKYKRVRDFDELGHAELSLSIRLPDGTLSRHNVWIEPHLLHLPDTTRSSS